MLVLSFRLLLSDPAGTRTQDPYIKSVLLYQLSYQIKTFLFQTLPMKSGCSTN